MQCFVCAKDIVLISHDPYFEELAMYGTDLHVTTLKNISLKAYMYCAIETQTGRGSSI